jgi:hypothetical protein
MTKTRAVLGASDPEMNMIEQLCKDRNIPTHYAIVGNARVNPGNAYKADSIDPPIPDDDSDILRVECNGPVFDTLTSHRIVVIDHHFPGDSGYGRSPNEYWEASSIGQTWVALGITEEPLPILRLVAAADHCLAAAYQGQCPGVNPDDLSLHRAQVKALHQKRCVEEVLGDIEKAKSILLERVSGFGPMSVALVGQKRYIASRPATITRVWREQDEDGYPTEYAAWQYEYADLRGCSVPELPEAAAQLGIPFLADMRQGDKTKIVLQAAPPDLVERFMRGEIVRGLEGIYGDPERGYAGGFTKA